MKIWLLVAIVAFQAQADFAGISGFSGQYGATCISCHNVNAPQSAVASLEGLPSAWDYGGVYTLDIRVSGGPPAVPGLPQGGFELSTNQGRFYEASHLLRQPTNQSVTYEPAGAMMRAWSVEWIAPTEGRPQEAQFWLAVVSANGNHNPDLNTSDGGETLDAVATWHTRVQPSDNTYAAFALSPLSQPKVLEWTTGDGAGLTLAGRHTDPDADGLRVQAGRAVWHVETNETWTIQLDIPDGTHVIVIQSTGDGRISEPLTYVVRLPELEFLSQPPEKETPSDLWPAMLAMGLLLWYRRT